MMAMVELAQQKKDGVSTIVTAQFLQVFYLHQPQALKKSRQNDAANAAMTTVCHLLNDHEQVGVFISISIAQNVVTILSFEEFLLYLLPMQQMICFLAAYHISCVAFFCHGIGKFLSIPIAHLLAEVMQIFGRV
jgi:hypothetical protein